MSDPCPRPTELLELIDGELTENHAAAVRTHLARCPACRAAHESQRRMIERLAASDTDLPSTGALDAVLRRLDASAPTRGPTRLRLAGALGGLAAAAALLAAVSLRPGPDAGLFTARGGTSEWSRRVGVELWTLENGPQRLARGQSLSPGAPLVAVCNNVDEAPAYLLAFGLDARGEVHWLYPAYLDRRTDPGSVRLEPSVVQRPLPESVVLEGVAEGPLRLVTVVTRSPLRVSDVETATLAERQPAALRLRWPEARIDELPVHIGASLPPRP